MSNTMSDERKLEIFENLIDYLGGKSVKPSECIKILKNLKITKEEARDNLAFFDFIYNKLPNSYKIGGAI